MAVAVTGWTTGAALADGGGLASFLARSPGERGETDLTKTTKKKGIAGTELAEADPEATQRALGKIFDTTPESALAPAETAAPAVVAPLSDAASAAPASTSGGSTGNTSSGGSSGGFPGGSSGGFFGGSSGGSSGGSDPDDPDDPDGSTSGGTTSGGTTSGGTTSGGTTTTTGGDVGAVPEPGTWMTMLLGMAMTGAALRGSRRPKKRKSSPCARAA